GVRRRALVALSEGERRSGAVVTGRARAVLVAVLAAALGGGLALEVHLTSSNASTRKAGPRDTTTTAPSTSTTTTEAPPPVKVPRVHAKPGTYATLVGLSPLAAACGDDTPSVVTAAMAQAVATGVTMIRCDLNWWNVQPNGPT